MAFDLPIKVDPGNTLGTLKGVEGGLAKTEARGKAAAQSMAHLGGAFKSLASAIQQEQSALQRTAQLHDQLLRKNQPLVQSIRGLADALERERVVLERIQGPAREFAADLQALHQLHRRGAIDAQQYTAELQRLHAQMGRAPASGAASGGARPGVLGGAVGRIGAVGSAASGALSTAAAPLALAAGAGFGVSQVVEMTDAYTNLQNRLGVVTKSQDEAAAAMQKVRQVARNTRSDLGSTGEAFVRISLATKEMGLSQGEVLSLTETLNKAIIMSGTSSQEAAAGMMQLSQGLASGRLQGDEMRSVLENLPIVADTIAKSLGVTRGQFRQMGADGKITSQVIVEAFRKQKDEIDSGFGKSVPTISQQVQVFKNEVSVMVAELVKSSGGIGVMTSALQDLGFAMKASAAIGKELFGVLNDAGFGGGLIGNVKKFLALDDGEEALLANGKAAAEAREQLVKYLEAMAQGGGVLQDEIRARTEWALKVGLGEQAAKRFHDLTIESTHAVLQGKVAVQGFAGTFGALSQGIAEANGALTRLGDALRDNPMNRALGIAQERTAEIREAKLQLKGLEEAYKMGGIEAALYRQRKEALLHTINGTTRAIDAETKALRELIKAERERRNVTDVRNPHQGVASFSMIQPGDVPSTLITGEGGSDDPRTATERAMAQFGINAGDFAKHTDPMRAELDELATAAEEAAMRTQMAWAEGLGQVGASFLEAAMKGEQSFGQMTEKLLRDIALLTLKMAALQIGGPGGAFASALIGGLGGMATGGTFRVPYDSDRMVLPRAATGANWMVGGSGGTDSKIAMFRVSPREEVSVRTPEQQAQRAVAAGPTRVTNIVQVSSDPREVTGAMGSHSGAREYVKLNRRFNRRR